jgi:1,4-dihydroxy-2-naphthoate octaprenyltransferase
MCGMMLAEAVLKEAIMTETKSFLGPIRLPFLILTPACFLLGVATAFRTSGRLDVLNVVLAFIGALSAHISVNALNEYFDFKSELDTRTKRTPFSGGSGTLPENPHLVRYALAVGLTTLAITGLIGVYFAFGRGLAILPLGILGILTIFTYTIWITRYPILCLIAPGLGFGPLFVMGTHFVLTGEYSWTAFFASLVPFFLVSNLLLLNQFPDVEPDRSVGRRHFPILIGRQKSAILYAAFLILAFLAIVLGTALDYLPLGSLLGLLVAVLAVRVIAGVIKSAEDIQKLVPYMGMNVIITIATPILVAAGIFIG